jgi:heme exporter protein D
MNLGPHAVFIIASYIVTVVVVAGLIAWIVADYAAQRRLLGELDARGVRRRSHGEDTP